MLILKRIFDFLENKKFRDLHQKSEIADHSHKNQKAINEEEANLGFQKANSKVKKSNLDTLNAFEKLDKMKNLTNLTNLTNLIKMKKHDSKLKKLMDEENNVKNIKIISKRDHPLISLTKENSKFIENLEGDIIDLSEMLHSEEEISRELLHTIENKKSFFKCNTIYNFKCGKFDTIENSTQDKNNDTNKNHNNNLNQNLNLSQNQNDSLKIQKNVKIHKIHKIDKIDKDPKIPTNPKIPKIHKIQKITKNLPNFQIPHGSQILQIQNNDKNDLDFNDNTSSKRSMKKFSQVFSEKNNSENTETQENPNKNECTSQFSKNLPIYYKVHKQNWKYHSSKPILELKTGSNKHSIKEKYDKLYCSISKANQLLKFNSLYPKRILRNSSNKTNLNSSYKLKKETFAESKIIPKVQIANKTEEENNLFSCNASEFLDSKSSVIKPSSKSEFKFTPFILKGSIASNSSLEFNAFNSIKLKEESVLSSFISHHRRSCLNNII